MVGKTTIVIRGKTGAPFLDYLPNVQTLERSLAIPCGSMSGAMTDRGMNCRGYGVTAIHLFTVRLESLGARNNKSGRNMSEANVGAMHCGGYQERVNERTGGEWGNGGIM